jgi:hypothetical protein
MNKQELIKILEDEQKRYNDSLTEYYKTYNPALLEYFRGAVHVIGIAIAYANELDEKEDCEYDRLPD